MRRLILPVIALLASCGSDQQPIEIAFAVQYGDHALGCGGDSAPVELTDLRFFLYDLRLFAADGSELPVSLTVDDRWQSNTVALVDLENGAGACLNGSRDMHTVVSGAHLGQASKGLAFRIGVPEALNHANPLLAAPPLSDMAMHWHWTSGYKYIRAGVQTADDGFFLHLGSSRCKRLGSDTVRCEDANRPEVRLDDFAPGQDGVVIDLAMLLSGIDLADGEPGRCMSGPGEADCESPLANLGVAGSDRPGAAAPVFRVADQ